jgi:hypothetical protein
LSALAAGAGPFVSDSAPPAAQPGAGPLGYRPITVPPPTGVGQADPTGRWHFDGRMPATAQGWKLYVSASLPHYLATLAAVAPVLRAHRVPFKYAASDRALRKLNAGLSGYSQVGKTIVAYLGEGVEAEALVADLAVVLEPFRGRAPEVPFARAIGGGLPLSYRYGAYDGPTLTIGDTVREDVRNDADAAIPAGFANPFAASHEPPVEHRAFEQFLLRYPIFDVLAQGGKGGVFAALDVEADTFTELVLKVGYRNGQVLPDGRDGMDLLATEYRFFTLLMERNLAGVAPRLLDYQAFPWRAALAMERIDGVDLMKLKREGGLDVAHLDSALALLDRVHAAGLFLGDAKLANFVASETGTVHAIDFECAGTMRTGAVDLLRTFHFLNLPPVGLAGLDRIHFLFSALYNERARTSFSERDRLIDVATLPERHAPATALEAWALERLLREIRG